MMLMVGDDVGGCKVADLCGSYEMALALLLFTVKLALIG